MVTAWHRSPLLLVTVWYTTVYLLYIYIMIQEFVMFPSTHPKISKMASAILYFFLFPPVFPGPSLEKKVSVGEPNVCAVMVPVVGPAYTWSTGKR